MTDDYPPNWDEIAAYVKKAADGKCEHCAHPHNPAIGRTLTVHHLDGVKAHCEYTNLVALCQRCHLHLQARFHPAQPMLPGFKAFPWTAQHALPFPKGDL